MPKNFIEQHYVAGSDIKLNAGDITLQYNRGDNVLLHRDEKDGAFVKHFKEDGSVVEVNITRLPDDLYSLFDHIISVNDELDEELSFVSVSLRDLSSNRSISARDIISLSTENNYEFNTSSMETTINNVPVRMRNTKQSNRDKLESLKKTSPTERTEGAVQRNLHSIEARRVGSTAVTGYVVDRQALSVASEDSNINEIANNIVDVFEGNVSLKVVAFNRALVTINESEGFTEDTFVEGLKNVKHNFTLIDRRDGSYFVEIPVVEDNDSKVVEGSNFMDENSVYIENKECCSQVEVEETEEDVEESDEDSDEIESAISYSDRKLNVSEMDLTLNDIWNKLRGKKSSFISKIKRTNPTQKLTFNEGVAQRKLVCPQNYDLVDGSEGPLCISVSESELEKLIGLVRKQK